MEKLLLRVSEVAEVIGLGKSATYQLIAAGSIPCVRLGKGRSVRVSADRLRQWVEELQASQGPAKNTQKSEHSSKTALSSVSPSTKI
jgi:excisionase family DNA binding protein